MGYQFSHFSRARRDGLIAAAPCAAGFQDLLFGAVDFGEAIDLDGVVIDVRRILPRFVP